MIASVMKKQREVDQGDQLLPCHTRWILCNVDILALLQCRSIFLGRASRQFAEEVIVDDHARDRRRRLGAKTTVLDQHGQRDLRLVGGA
jgi:hypothetical protein